MAVFKVMGVDNDLWLVAAIHHCRLSVGLEGCLFNRLLCEDVLLVIIASDTQLNRELGVLICGPGTPPRYFERGYG